MYSDGKNGLEQLQMERCQPIGRLKEEEEKLICIVGYNRNNIHFLVWNEGDIQVWAATVLLQSA